jgi:cytosine/adenosine deaminase-related metal-dependent hydrolase
MKVLLSADWIVKPSGEYIEKGWVVIKDGLVNGYLRRKPEGNFQKEIHFSGALFPPFVNAHTHLELSGVKFSPNRFKDFFEWLLFIIGKRQTFTQEELRESFFKGINELKSYGIAFAGDISSFGIARTLSKEVKIPKVKSFLEIIGKDSNIKKLTPPISIHSIYSVSFELIRKIGKDALERGYRFQIHLGETFDEELFVRCKENRFEKLVYPVVGRKRYERVKAENVVDYLEKAGALSELTIAVHCTNLSRKELDKLVEKGASIVLCPRSNIHLKTGFPDIEHLLGYEKLGIGTDGLSTNISLSVVEEIKVIYYRLEGRVPLRELFKLITLGGAKALGIRDYGKQALFTLVKSDKELETPFDLFLYEPLRFEILDFSSSL